MKLNEMHVLLTGASGGIGKATAIALADAGARIIAVGRNETALRDLIEELPAHPLSAHCYFRTDICDGAQRAQLVERLQGLQEPPNVLINMAGTNQFKLFCNQNEAEVSQMIDTNITATLLLTQALIPLLAAQPAARILVVGSTLGSIGYPGYVSYSTTKFALRGFSEALSRELGDSSIRVQYFAPRATETGLNSEAANALNRALKNAVDSPRQVARALVSFMKGDETNRYLGWPERLFVRINGLFPSMVTGSIVKQLPIIKNHANPDH